MISHAKLSPSSSSKWLYCSGSINAERGYANKSSFFAEEGTLAHELADQCLKSGKDAAFFIDKMIDGKIIDKTMADFVQEYIDYVLAHETNDSMLFTEKRVSFNNIVPNGYGTMDAAVLDKTTKTCHIFDLKYGQGMTVDAFENTQAIIYAIGFYNDFGDQHDIEHFRLHIVQPRKFNNTHYDMTVADLNKKAQWIKARAELTIASDAPRTAGEKQCQWCKAKADCPTLHAYTEQTLTAHFDDLTADTLSTDKLTQEQKRKVLDSKKLIETFLKSVEESVSDTLQSGGSFEGYKLVHGRSVRKWNEEAADVLEQQLGDDAYSKKLIGITQAEKLLGADVLKPLTFKPEGKPTLAPASDKRQAIANVADCFDIL